MNASVCYLGHKCGAFNMCTMEMKEKCGGAISPTEQSIQLFNMLLPDKTEFQNGYCQHCGKETLVAQVNQFTNACRNCWINNVLQRRIICVLKKSRETTSA